MHSWYLVTCLLHLNCWCAKATESARGNEFFPPAFSLSSFSTHTKNKARYGVVALHHVNLRNRPLYLLSIEFPCNLHRYLLNVHLHVLWYYKHLSYFLLILVAIATLNFDWNKRRSMFYLSSCIINRSPPISSSTCHPKPPLKKVIE